MADPPVMSSAAAGDVSRGAAEILLPAEDSVSVASPANERVPTWKAGKVVWPRGDTGTFVVPEAAGVWAPVGGSVVVVGAASRDAAWRAVARRSDQVEVRVGDYVAADRLDGFGAVLTVDAKGSGKGGVVKVGVDFTGFRRARVAMWSLGCGLLGSAGAPLMPRWGSVRLTVELALGVVPYRVSAAGIRSLNVTAKAFRAGFHMVTHRACPRPLGSS